MCIQLNNKNAALNLFKQFTEILVFSKILINFLSEIAPLSLDIFSDILAFTAARVNET